jgi:hypothetical protein
MAFDPAVVSDLYLTLLHGNFMRATGAAFERALRHAVRELDETHARALLAGGWRERLTAAWVSGLRDERALIPRLSELLLESAVPFAGQGYCAALAAMPGDESRAGLGAYLDAYLPRLDLDYDQPWACAALELVGPADHARFGPACAAFAAKHRAQPVPIAAMIARLRTFV